LPPFADSALFGEKQNRLFVVVKGDEIVVTVTRVLVPLIADVLINRGSL
jgi:hypothetical protein